MIHGEQITVLEIQNKHWFNSDLLKGGFETLATIQVLRYGSSRKLLMYNFRILVLLKNSSTKLRIQKRLSLRNTYMRILLNKIHLGLEEEKKWIKLRGTYLQYY